MEVARKHAGGPAARTDIEAVAAVVPLPVAGVATGLLVLGLLAADRAVGDVFVLDGPTAIPSVVTSLLLALSALLAWVRGGSGLAVGLAFASLAQLAGVTQRVLEGAGASESTIALAVAASLAGAAVLVLALLAALQARRPAGTLGAALPATLRILRGVDAGRAAFAVGLAYVAICGLGATVLVADLPIESMTINEEGTYPQYFNAALLIAGGMLSLLLWRTRTGQTTDPRWWLGFGLFLIYLGIDESTGLHERVQSQAGVDSSVVLAPIALTGAILFFATFRIATRLPRTRLLYLLGAACFAFSQVVDVVGDSALASATEEVFETSGSALLAAALFVLARAAPDGDRGPAPGP